MRSAFLMIFLAAGPCRAASEPAVPRYAVEAFCEARGDVGARAPLCLVSENRARTDVTAAWRRFPLQRRHFCIQSVRFLAADARSYSALWQCLSGPTGPTDPTS